MVYPIISLGFGLTPRDIGGFIVITSAIEGTMQLAHGVLTRYVARLSSAAD